MTGKTINVYLSSEHFALLDRLALAVGKPRTTLAREILITVLEEAAKGHREAQRDAIGNSLT